MIRYRKQRKQYIHAEKKKENNKQWRQVINCIRKVTPVGGGFAVAIFDRGRGVALGGRCGGAIPASEPTDVEGTLPKEGTRIRKVPIASCKLCSLQNMLLQTRHIRSGWCAGRGHREKSASVKLVDSNNCSPNGATFPSPLRIVWRFFSLLFVGHLTLQYPMVVMKHSTNNTEVREEHDNTRLPVSEERFSSPDKPGSSQSSLMSGSASEDDMRRPRNVETITEIW